MTARQLSRSSSEYDELTESIVQKADGVFIWVILVIRSLLSGLGNYCSISQLRKRLDAVPTELNSMFQYMLEEIDRSEKRAAARTFIVMKSTTSDQPNTWVYIHSVLDDLEDDHEYEKKLLRKGLHPFQPGEMGTGKCVLTVHRLIGRCRGLLQVVYTGLNFPYCHRLQFVHRTVRDFLGDEGIVRELQTLSGGFCPFRGVALGLLHLAKCVPEEQWRIPCRGYQSTQIFGDIHHRKDHPLFCSRPSFALHVLLSLAGAAELAGCRPLIQEIVAMKEDVETFRGREFEHHLGTMCFRALLIWMFSTKTMENTAHTILCMAASEGAIGYVKAELESQNPDAEILSLLLPACLTALETNVKPEHILGITRFLFEQKASPNLELGDLFSVRAEHDTNESDGEPGSTTYFSSMPWTPWTLLLMRISEMKILRHSKTAYTEFMQLYLDYGAHISVCFVGYRLTGGKSSSSWDETDWELMFQREDKEIIDSMEGPFYTDLPTMLEVWGPGLAMPPETWLSQLGATTRRLISSWFSPSTPNNGLLQKIGYADIQKENFLVLGVLSCHRLKDIRGPELEEALRLMLMRGRACC